MLRFFGCSQRLPTYRLDGSLNFLVTRSPGSVPWLPLALCLSSASLLFPLFLCLYFYSPLSRPGHSFGREAADCLAFLTAKCSNVTTAAISLPLPWPPLCCRDSSFSLFSARAKLLTRNRQVEKTQKIKRCLLVGLIFQLIVVEFGTEEGLPAEFWESEHFVNVTREKE